MRERENAPKQFTQDLTLPRELRRRALDSALTPFEFGRVLGRVDIQYSVFDARADVLCIAWPMGGPLCQFTEEHEDASARDHG